MSKLEPTLTYSNHTATEVLRRLLDELGVEWGASDTYRLLVTSWNDVSGHSWAFMEHRDGSFSKLTAYHMTPEQAIAATLGATDAKPTQAESSGTCHITPWKMERGTGFYDCMECSECGYVTDVSEWAKATYCAGCGRRIEQ